MADTATGHAVGKVILCGEHAVVYGYPAIAAGIDRGTTVHITAQAGPTTIQSASGVDARLRHAVHHVVGPSGWRVSILSDLPMGRGMGSSAALSVALVRANRAIHATPMSMEEEHAAALAVETIFHGTPSGIDNAVAARGGVLRFRRDATGPVWTPIDCAPMSLVVLDSGQAGDTKALVAGVRERHPQNTPILDAIGTLTDNVQRALPDPSALGPLFTDNHRLLAQLGVSSPVLDDLVALAVAGGATGAKLAGAGGGGIVIAVGPDPDAIVAYAQARGVAAFHTLIQREA